MSGIDDDGKPLDVNLSRAPVFAKKLRRLGVDAPSRERACGRSSPMVNPEGDGDD